MTTTTALTFLLISIVLVQISWSKPTTTDEDLCLMKSKYQDLIQPSENDKLFPPSGQLLVFSATGLEKLTEKYAKGGKKISEQLLHDNEILNSKSSKVLEFKQNLTNFEENYSKCDGLLELFALAESYSNTTSFYYEQDEASFDDDSKLIVGLLRKYNSEELDKEFEKYFDIFVADFIKKFYGLKENLAKEETKLSKKISDWFVHFKTLKSYDDKIAAVNKYVELYD